jgi:hypothetical protein
MKCDMEIPGSVPVRGVPGGTLELALFSGGSCTPTPLGAFTGNSDDSSCNPLQPAGSQGCGDGVCDLVPELSSASEGLLVVACRAGCEPSATVSGCARDGYSCDFTYKVCLEGCASDAECRLKSLDSDNDGEIDGLEYDEASTASCDPKLARCTHPAGPQASGESCERDDDCAQDGICITDASDVAGQLFPGGMCTRRGCNVPGLECDGAAVCEPLRPLLDDSTATTPMCLTRCTVGAEPAASRLGSQGHGQGCRAGYRCAYNGSSGAQGGVCVGGVYKIGRAHV